MHGQEITHAIFEKIFLHGRFIARMQNIHWKAHSLQITQIYTSWSDSSSDEKSDRICLFFLLLFLCAFLLLFLVLLQGVGCNAWWFSSSLKSSNVATGLPGCTFFTSFLCFVFFQRERETNTTMHFKKW